VETPTRGRFGSAPYLTGPGTFGWAIAGPGRNAAPRFAEAVRNLPPNPDEGSVQARIVGVHSRNDELARRFAETYQIAHTSPILATLLGRSEVQCVYVANHPRRHAATVLEALQAGKHVLCEPPLAYTVDETLDLWHAARDRGLTLAINYQHRLDPALAIARHNVAELELGELMGGSAAALPLLSPVDIDRRIDPSWGGLLFDHALRLVDVLHFVCGESIVTASAFAGPAPIGARGAADLHAILRLRNGPLFHLHASYQVAHGHSHLDLIGSAGTLIADPLRSDRTSALAFHGMGGAHTVTVPSVDLWEHSILAFQYAVLTGNSPPATAADEATNLCVTLALADSLRASAQRAVQYPHALSESA
jgi:predicted dehydrogenase